jgi:hypothetical protein
VQVTRSEAAPPPRKGRPKWYRRAPWQSYPTRATPGIGELLGDWLAIRMAEVDAEVDEARAKVDAIPDRRSLMLLIGELTVRLHCVELAIDELKAAKR